MLIIKELKRKKVNIEARQSKTSVRRKVNLVSINYWTGIFKRQRITLHIQEVNLEMLIWTIKKGKIGRFPGCKATY